MKSNGLKISTLPTFLFLILFIFSTSFSVHGQTTSQSNRISWNNISKWNNPQAIPGPNSTVNVQHLTFAIDQSSLLVKDYMSSFTMSNAAETAYFNSTTNTVATSTNQSTTFCPFTKANAGAQQGCIGLFIGAGGIYNFGAVSPSLPLFNGSITGPGSSLKSITSTANFPVEIDADSFIQTTNGGSGAVYGLTQPIYYNNILGTVLSKGGSSVDLVDNANYSISAAPYTGSVFLDPLGAPFVDLYMNGGSGKATLNLYRGVTNFEGGALLWNSNVNVEAGATLILGPLECKLCDSNDPSSTAATRASSLCSGTVCKQTALDLKSNVKFTIKEGGRVIVYGNVFVDGVAGGNGGSNGTELIVNGGLYLTGKLFLDQATLTSTDGQATGNYKGDIYAGGGIDVSSGASSNLFGEVAADCPIQPCSATQAVCGYAVSISPQGVIPACSSISVVASITGSFASAPTFQYERFDSQSGSWSVLGASTTGSSATVYSFPTAPVPSNHPNWTSANQYYYSYRLKVTTGVVGQASYCVAYSPSFQVTYVDPTINFWRGDLNGTNGSTDASLPVNWCFGVPNSQTISVNIASNTKNVYPTISTGTFNANNFSIATGASVNLTGGTVNLYGDLNFVGTAKFNASGTNAVVFNGGNKSIALTNILTGSNLQFQNLTVASGATLNLPPGPLTAPAPSTIANEVKVFGNVSVSGTLNGNCVGCFVTSAKSRLIFNGSGEQLVTSAGVSSLNLDDVHLNQTGTSSVKLMGSNFNLFGKLTFETGSLTDLKSLNTGVGAATGKLVLKSVSSNYLYNSSVGIIPGAGNINGSKISGTVRVERFVPDRTSFSGSLFRYFASPVKSSTFPSLFGSRYYYSKSLIDNTMARYVNTATANETIMVGGRGYAVSYRNSNTNKAWFVEGELNQGNQKILCPTGCVEPSFKGWHLIGNPFPHPIKWASFNDVAVSDTYNGQPLSSFGELNGGIAGVKGSPQQPTVLRPGISRIVSVRAVGGETERSRQYLALPGPFLEKFWSTRLTPSILQSGECNYCFNGVIDIGQSFWVYSYGSGDGTNNSSDGFPASEQDATLWITEDAKNITSAPTFYNRQESANIGIKTLAVILTDGLSEDVAYQTFNKNKKSDRNPDFVVPKIPTLESEIYFLNDKEGELLLNETGQIDENVRIPIGFTATAPGTYYIKFELDSAIRSAVPLYLVDNLLGSVTPIDDPNGYMFFAEKEGKVNDRFYLTGNPEFEKRKWSVLITPNPVSGKIFYKIFNYSGNSVLSVSDCNGRKLLESQVDQEGEVSVDGLPNGLYFVKITNNDGDRVVKIIKNAAN